MPYMTGVTNYPTHAAADKDFSKTRRPAALEMHNDGTASIVYLQDTPVQHGQHEYTGRKTLVVWQNKSHLPVSA
jgi:hypothetical protein